MTSVGPWGTSPDAQQPGTGGLSSSLGGADLSGGGPWGTAAPASSGGGGGTGFFGSITNPFGIVTGAKQLVTGIGKGLATPFVDTAFAAGNLLTGNVGGAETSIREAGQAVGDFGGAMITSAENLGADIAHPIGALSSSIGGPDVGSAYDSAVQALNRTANDTPLGVSIYSDEMRKSLMGTDGQGAKPTDLVAASRQGGIATGVVGQALQLAMVAAPFAGAAASIAGDAAAASEAAAGSAGAAEAAVYAARTQSIADVLHGAAHPVEFAGQQLGRLGVAARNVAYPAMLPDGTPNPESGPTPFAETHPVISKAMGIAGNPVGSALAGLGKLGKLGKDALGGAADVASTDAAAPGEAAPVAPAAPPMSNEDAHQAIADVFAQRVSSNPTPVTSPEVTAAVDAHLHGPDLTPTTSAGDEWVNKNIPVSEGGGNVQRAENAGNVLPTVTMQVTPGMIEPPVAPTTEQIPINKVVSAQGSINPDQVKNVLNGTEAGRPVDAVNAGNGNWMLEDGNHRVAAAVARGDTTIEANVTGTVADPNGELATHIQGQLDKHPGLPASIDNGSPTVTPAADVAASENQPAPRSVAPVEPDKINTVKGRPDIGPVEQALRDEKVLQDQATARANNDTHLPSLTELARKAQEAPPGWATKVAEHLPPQINQVLSHFADIADKARIRTAWRNVEQLAQTEQQRSLTSPAMKAGGSAIRDLLAAKTGLSRPEISVIVGQELRARLGGSSYVSEFARDHAGELANEEITARLVAAARGKNVGLTAGPGLEAYNKLSAIDRAVVDNHLNTAVKGFQAENAQTMQTLISTRFGAQGLEAALLGDRTAIMTHEQVATYKQAMNDQATAEKLRARATDRAALERDVAAQNLLGAKVNGVEQTLIEKLNTTEQTVAQLGQAVPKGLANNADRGVAVTLRTLDANAANGFEGATIDVGNAEGRNQPDGIAIGVTVHPQAVIPDSEWTDPTGPHSREAVIRDVINHPRASDGATPYDPAAPAAHYRNDGTIYDPARLWGGNDARLGIWHVPGVDGAEGHWYVDLSMSTDNNVPLEPWKADVLGVAFKQQAGWDNAAQANVPFSQDPARQALAANFVEDVLNPNSHISKLADELSRTPDAYGQARTPAEVTTEVWKAMEAQHAIMEPSSPYDPMSAQYRPQPIGGKVDPKARWETDAGYQQRLRQYINGTDKLATLREKVRVAAQNAAKVQKATNTMNGLLLEPTRTELRIAKLEGRSEDALTKLNAELGQPGRAQTPQQYVPMMESWQRLAAEANADPTGATLAALGEIPQSFGDILDHADRLGFEPTHVPDLTWQQARKYLFQHLNLSNTVEKATLRMENKGVLQKFNLATQSLESLGAASVMAMREKLMSTLFGHIEDTYARQWEQGKEIPQGWHSWDAARDNIIVGRHADAGGEIAVSANKIIPDAVFKALRGVTRDPTDWAFRSVMKGGPTAIWKNVMLTWSPSWYVKHFVGSVTLATIEGVRWGDWMKAIKNWRTDAFDPEVQAGLKESPLSASVRGRSMHSIADEQMGSMGTAVSPRLREIPGVFKSDGFRQGMRDFNGKLKNIVKTTDTLARAAVYERTLRLNPGNIDLAASRAYNAIGDFGRLSPVERGAVTAIMPFYSFQKSMFRILAKMPIDHPLATSLLFQLGEMHTAYMKEQLGGSLPEMYTGANFIGGHLMRLDKLNPLMDSYKLLTPEGIGSSLHPFLGVLAQQAFDAPSFGGGVKMGAFGQLAQQPTIGQELLGSLTSSPAFGGVGDIASGEPISALSSAAPTSGLSDAQYQKLLARILKTQAAQQKVATQGAYPKLDVQVPKKAATGVWG